MGELRVRVPSDTQLESGLISCTECGSAATSDDSVCSRCGGFLAGSPMPSLGVFSARAYLDDFDEDPAPDLKPVLKPVLKPDLVSELESETVLVVEREVEPVAQVRAEEPIPVAVDAPVEEVEVPLEVAVQASAQDDVEIAVAVEESKWPIVSQVLVGIFYLLFVIAVAVAVNKILRAL